MYLEYINTSIDYNDTQFKTLLVDKISKIDNLKKIIVPYFFLKQASLYRNKDHQQVSCLIDFPLGFSDSKSRQTSIENALKAGASHIDIMVPAHYLANRKYDKIREDIKTQINLIDKNNIRYILEYRMFNHNSLKKMCEILVSNGIFNIITSSGYRLDNINDFIIASQFLQSHFEELKISLSANFWSEKHFKLINKQSFASVISESVEILQDFNKTLK